MGGCGSGRTMHWGARQTTEACSQIDVNALRRAGHLEPGAAAYLVPPPMGKGIQGVLKAFAAEVKLRCEDQDYITLRYQAPHGDDWSWIDHGVDIEWFPAGGSFRPYFRCPQCGGRAVKLYRRGRFACRKCQNLAYQSEQSSVRDRLLLKVFKIRRRLGGDTSLAVPIPPRPRYMRRKAYEALWAEAAWLEQRYWGALPKSLARKMG